jgi:pSer/pThr/pTyr-binding forkhead associated (FHA) protein/tetratricopeptide (TPR) repeat protein
MWKLCIEDDEGNQTVVPIIRDEITIGRQEGNTIRLTERNVSRRHAKLMRTETGFYVEPLEPRYGIKRNGEKIQDRAEFREGDIFLIGDYRLTLQSERAVQAPPLPDPAGKPPGSVAPPMPAAASQGGFASEPTQITRRPPNEGTEIIPTMPAKLVVVSSNFAGQEFPLTRREMVIGRGEECDIIIDHRSVSQTHAKVTREAGNVYQIIDLNSKNGVRIGGEKYTHVHIKRGDIIELGHVKFRFVEPGENYVFTPQSILPDGEDLSSAGGGKSKVGLISAVVAVAALLIGGGIFYAMSGGGKEQSERPAQPVVATPDAGAVAEVAGLSEPVVKGLKKAEEQIASGEIEKAIGVLEILRDSATSAQDQEKIDAALALARNEKPFRNHYIVLKDDLQKKSYVDALRNINKIPKHSVFQKLIEGEGLRAKAIDGAMAQAQRAYDSKKWDDARAILDEVLLLDADNEQARGMVAQLEERSKPVAVAVKPADKEPKEPKEPKEAKPKEAKPKPAEPEFVSEDEARELLKSAQRKVIAGDWAGAISDCGKGIRGGQHDCYRVMGMAYKGMDDKPKACKSYERFLKEKPTNSAAIEREMAKLGCDSL